jgi:hypothetical protein
MALDATVNSEGPKDLKRTKDHKQREEVLREHTRITREIDDLGQVMRMINAIPINDPAPVPRNSPKSGGLPKDGIGNAFVAVRDITIRKYKDLSARQICAKPNAD